MLYPSLVAGSPLTSFAEAGLTIPIVSLSNLTHPAWGSNFQVGDTFQVTIVGAAPYQLVYRSRAWSGSSSTTQIGQTDGAGRFQASGAQGAGAVGTYTDVYSVGSVQAQPALTYVVAAAGGVGWIATGETGQTPNGSVDGFSYLSISNGSSVYTYSATYFGYSTSAYYNTQTVATLYQDGQPIRQAMAIDPSDAQGSLTATAAPLSDYTLQTDHYVLALVPIGGSFYNPSYFGDGSCDDASSDCSIGIGNGPILVIAASIYLGSTVADQTAVPIPFTYLTSTQLPSSVAHTSDMIQQIAVLAALTEVAINDAWSVGNSVSDPPVPSFIQMTCTVNVPSGVCPTAATWPGDIYAPDTTKANGVKRERTYIVKDAYGKPWNKTYPLLIKERFFQISLLGSLPAADGRWVSEASKPMHSGESVQWIDGISGRMVDSYGFAGLFAVQYNQYYYATEFQLPPRWNFSSSAAFNWPLIISDKFNTCVQGEASLPGQTINLTPTGVGVNGDSGPPQGYNGRPGHSGCGSPTFP